jgi:putative transposase
VSDDLIHQLPGTTFSNVKQRGAYPSEAKAAIDIETLTHLLVKWIVDYYHDRPHRGLAGKTPLEVWREGCSERVIELPAFPAELDLIGAHVAHSTVFHYGIQVDNLFYNSDLLRELRSRRDERLVVEVRYREEDVSKVLVRDPRSNEFFEVPCVDRQYSAGLNRSVHRLIVAQARQRFRDEWKQFQLLEIRGEIEAIIAKALTEGRVLDRKRAARHLMHDSEAVIRPLPYGEEAPVVDSEISSAVDALLDFVGSGEVEAYPAVDLNMTEEGVLA